MDIIPWISVKDAAPQFGMSPGAARNAIARERFPVPVYKLGKKSVISKVVLKAYFDAREAEGLARLANMPKTGAKAN